MLGEGNPGFCFMGICENYFRSVGRQNNNPKFQVCHIVKMKISIISYL